MGFTFATISQVNHISVHTLQAFDNNWYAHQCVTSLNYGPQSLLALVWSGALNFQIEHHLFPGVNHCHLPQIARKVEAICKKHGVPYNCVDTYFQALQLHVSVLACCAKAPKLV